MKKAGWLRSSPAAAVRSSSADTQSMLAPQLKSVGVPDADFWLNWLPYARGLVKITQRFPPAVNGSTVGWYALSASVVSSASSRAESSVRVVAGFEAEVSIE